MATPRLAPRRSQPRHDHAYRLRAVQRRHRRRHAARCVGRRRRRSAGRVRRPGRSQPRRVHPDVRPGATLRGRRDVGQRRRRRERPRPPPGEPAAQTARRRRPRRRSPATSAGDRRDTGHCRSCGPRCRSRRRRVPRGGCCRFRRRHRRHRCRPRFAGDRRARRRTRRHGARDDRLGPWQPAQPGAGGRPPARLTPHAGGWCRHRSRAGNTDGCRRPRRPRHLVRAICRR